MSYDTESKSRNADFISIAAKRRYHHPLNPVNLLNLFLHNPSTQPAAPAATATLGAKGSVKLTNPLAVRPVNPKNPGAAGVSNEPGPQSGPFSLIISFPVIIRKNKYSYFRFISYCLLALDSVIMLLKNI